MSIKVKKILNVRAKKHTTGAIKHQYFLDIVISLYHTIFKSDENVCKYRLFLYCIIFKKINCNKWL